MSAPIALAAIAALAVAAEVSKGSANAETKPARKRKKKSGPRPASDYPPVIQHPEIPFDELDRSLRPKMKGAVIYDGPSRINGKPIVALLQYESDNAKTGNTPQVWILPKMDPNLARRTGGDVCVCGGCIFSRNNGCYVSGRALDAVWRSYQSGRNYSDRRHAQWWYKRERPPTTRIGSYGDPVAVPIEVWEWLSSLPGENEILGYTQEWKNPRADGYQKFCMASTKSRKESELAELMGWRYFRVATPGDEGLAERQIVCPHVEDDQNACKGCQLCTGGDVTTDKRPHIVNPVHGVAKKRATAGLLKIKDRGSRSVALQVVATRVNPVGMRPSAVMRSMSRGRPHDPRAISSVEVTLSGTPEQLRSREAFELVKRIGRKDLPSVSFGQIVSGIYKDRMGRTVCRYEVS
jgi:hypothetical protein